MSFTRARSGPSHRAPVSRHAVATEQRFPPGPAYGTHRASGVRRGLAPDADRHAAGRHARAAYASPFVMAKRAGLASLVTAISMGGVTLVQAGGVATAGAPAVTHATVDFSSSARTQSASRGAPSGRAAGPATVRSFSAGSTRVAIPKALPLVTTAGSTAAGTGPKAAPAIQPRKAGPATTREIRVADVLDCEEPKETTGFANGQLPRQDLCVIPGTGQMLRTDAAAAFIGLSAAFRRHFGEDIQITDSYRDLASQVALFARKPTLAAVPGTSQHGWGIAVDLASDIDKLSSAAHQWMLDNAPRFGWDNPAWARPGGSKLEPWHWEYTAPGTDSAR